MGPWARVLAAALLAAASVRGDAAGSGLKGTRQVASESRLQPLAILDGKPIGEADLASRLAVPLAGLEARNAIERDALIRRTLEDAITDDVIEAHARRNNKTVSMLLLSSMTARGKGVTNADVRAFHEANKKSLPGPFEAVAPAIRSKLFAERLAAERQTLGAELLARSSIKVLLTPLRFQVDERAGPSIGRDRAPVSIVLFADVHCRFCEKQYQALHGLLRQRPGKVQLRFRFFPGTGVDLGSDYSSVMAYCASEQNKFWPVHDAAITAGGKLSEVRLDQVAKQAALDVGKIRECAASPRPQEAINRDRAEGMLLGVQGTPTLFVEGRPVIGLTSVDRLTKIVDEEIALAARKSM